MVAGIPRHRTTPSSAERMTSKGSECGLESGSAGWLGPRSDVVKGRGWRKGCVGRSGWHTGVPNPKRPSCSCPSGHQPVVSCGKDPGWEETWHFTHTYTHPGDAHTHTHTAHVSTVHGQVYTSSNTCAPSQIHTCIHVDSGRQTHAQHTSVGRSGDGGIP